MDRARSLSFGAGGGEAHVIHQRSPAAADRPSPHDSCRRRVVLVCVVLRFTMALLVLVLWSRWSVYAHHAVKRVKREIQNTYVGVLTSHLFGPAVMSLR